MKKLKKKIQSLWLLSLLMAFGLLAVSAKAQTYQLISLPNSTLTGAAAWGTTATTNLANGWTNTTLTTNIVTLWTNNPGAFVNYTNVVTNNALTFAEFDSVRQPFVTLQHQFNQTSGDTSNSVLVVARTVNGLFYDTINNVSITNTPLAAGTAAAPQVGVYQLDMRGYRRGRIISWTYQSTGVSDIMTNQGLYATGSDVKQEGQP